MDHSSPRNGRGNRQSRQSPLPRLETQHAPNNRFSFTMTPAQAHSSTFDGPEFSRPETILDKSPMTAGDYYIPESLPHPPTAPLPAIPTHAYELATRNTSPLPPAQTQSYELATQNTSPIAPLPSYLHEPAYRSEAPLPALPPEAYQVAGRTTSPQQTYPVYAHTIPASAQEPKVAYPDPISQASPELQNIHPAFRIPAPETQVQHGYQPPSNPLSPMSNASHTHSDSHTTVVSPIFSPASTATLSKKGPYSTTDMKNTHAPSALDFYSPYDHAPPTPRTASIPAYTPASPLGPNASTIDLRHQPDNNPLPTTNIHHPSTSKSKSKSKPSSAPNDPTHFSSSTLSPSTSCLSSLFCPCIVYGRVQYRLAQRSRKAEPTDLLGYSACNGQCGVMALACGLQGVLAAVQRMRVRRAYDIEGDFCGDCLRGCCCCCCTVGLMEEEVVRREEERRKLVATGAGAAGGYVRTGRLTYMPPPR